MNYAEKLKDPRWQRKRLEILQEAGFRCEYCDNADITLHVHHLSYVKGRQPWEYGSDTLICLCEDCHEISHSKTIPHIVKDLFVCYSLYKDKEAVKDLISYLKLHQYIPNAK